jgi:hypothetical protein
MEGGNIMKFLGKVSKKTKGGGIPIIWDRYLASTDWH